MLEHEARELLDHIVIGGVGISLLLAVWIVVLQATRRRQRALLRGNDRLELQAEELSNEIAERQRAEKELREINRDLQRLNERLDSTASELKALMKGVAEGEITKARFDGWLPVRCWEVKKCESTGCPAHDKPDNPPCWEISGTFCTGTVRQRPGEKLEDCRKCEVYQLALRDPVYSLGETFNEMMVILEDRQEALQKALQAAEAATQAKTMFLANMSHEMRTPMTAILGFAEILLEDADADSAPPERVNAALTIKRNGVHLLGIVNDLLDMSKIETGNMAVERIACSPCQIIAEVASSTRVQVEAKDVAFSVEFVDAIPETIQTDPTRLRQILINLIGNAAKFTKAGSVRLVTRFVGNGDDSFLQFDILDTGMGITEEQIANLFQPFTQADASVTRRFGGTGIGLNISRYFARMLGGDVTVVDSQIGVGSRFRATVATGPLEGVSMIEDPVSATVVVPRSDDAATHSKEGHLSGRRILLVEDGADNVRLISLILEKVGAEVHAAENGRIGVDRALTAREDGNPFDIILMDIQMPVLDGYGATRLLRAKGYTGPIIALTAYAMPEDEHKCRKAGCDAYLAKPVDRKKLVETIRSHLSEPALDAGGEPSDLAITARSEPVEKGYRHLARGRFSVA